MSYEVLATQPDTTGYGTLPEDYPAAQQSSQPVTTEMLVMAMPPAGISPIRERPVGEFNSAGQKIAGPALEAAAAAVAGMVEIVPAEETTAVGDHLRVVA